MRLLVGDQPPLIPAPVSTSGVAAAHDGADAISQRWDYDSAARKPRPLEELTELAGSGTLIRALVGRDMKVRYKRSVLGVAWTLVNPLAMLLVLWLAFGSVFQAVAPAYHFYVLPGLLLWMFVSQTTLTVVREMAAGVDLWRRVRVPKSALIIATVLTGLVNLGVATGVLVVVLVIARRPLGPELAALPVVVLLVTGFVLGVAFLLATAAAYFPDVADIYNLLIPALMFTAPIAYPRSVVGGRPAWLLQLNPITWFVEAFRGPLYAGRGPSVNEVAILAAIAILTLLAGWLVFTRAADDIPYQL